jgi:transposase
MPIATSNNAKNRQIVLNLYEKGIFDIKDAINQVADRLNISKHTVYLYIRQFKSGDFQGWISNAFCPYGDRPGLWHQQASSACSLPRPFAGRP